MDQEKNQAQNPDLTQPDNPAEMQDESSTQPQPAASNPNPQPDDPSAAAGGNDAASGVSNTGVDNGQDQTLDDPVATTSHPDQQALEEARKAVARAAQAQDGQPGTNPDQQANADSAETTATPPPTDEVQSYRIPTTPDDQNQPSTTPTETQPQVVESGGNVQPAPAEADASSTGNTPNAAPQTGIDEQADQPQAPKIHTFKRRRSSDEPPTSRQPQPNQDQEAGVYAPQPQNSANQPGATVQPQTGQSPEEQSNDQTQTVPEANTTQQPQEAANDHTDTGIETASETSNSQPQVQSPATPAAPEENETPAQPTPEQTDPNATEAQPAPQPSPVEEEPVLPQQPSPQPSPVGEEPVPPQQHSDNTQPAQPPAPEPGNQSAESVPMPNETTSAQPATEGGHPENPPEPTQTPAQENAQPTTDTNAPENDTTAANAGPGDLTTPQTPSAPEPATSPQPESNEQEQAMPTEPATPPAANPPTDTPAQNPSNDNQYSGMIQPAFSGDAIGTGKQPQQPPEGSTQPAPNPSQGNTQPPATDNQQPDKSTFQLPGQGQPQAQTATAETPQPQPPVPPAGNQTAENAPDSAQAKGFKNKLKQSTGKLKKVNYKPMVSAAVIGLVVYGLFNSQVILGQVQYLTTPSGGLDAPAADVDSLAPAGEEDKILIPKLDVDVPVVYDEPSFDEEKVQKALDRGVVHYGTTAMPGENGNNVIVGHSSNNWWDSGKYKFAFIMLDKLEEEDQIILHHEGTRYVYEVNGKQVVEPDNVSVLDQTEDPTLTLITCTPPGTSWQRLVVTADQVSPDPEQNQEASDSMNLPEGSLPSDSSGGFLDFLRNLF